MKYFSEKIDINLKKIYFHRAITALAVQLAGIFSVIFLYKFFGYNYVYVILFYVFLGVLTIILLPLVGKVINKISYKGTIVLGAFFRLFLWISYALTSFYNWKYGIIFIIISLLGIRIFYWVPYKTDFVTFRKSSDHSKSVSILLSIQNIVGIFAPVLAGFIISTYSYGVLYAIGASFLLLAIWPLREISRIDNKFTWSYLDSFKQLFNKKNKGFVVSSLFNGAESMVVFIWPIFIFEILKGDYLKIGSIATLTTLVVIILNLFIGKYTDKKRNEKTFLKYGTAMVSLAWLIKIFVTTAGQVFFIDIYHKVSSAVYGASYNSLVYGYQSDRGKLVDEYTLVNELSFRIGQTLSGIALLGLSALVSMNFLFIIAAIAVLLTNLIPKRVK